MKATAYMIVVLIVLLANIKPTIIESQHTMKKLLPGAIVILTINGVDIHVELSRVTINTAVLYWCIINSTTVLI